MTTTTTTKSTKGINMYPGDCFECSGRVNAYAGTRERFNGRWVVRHLICDEQATAIDTVLERPMPVVPSRLVCSFHGEDLDAHDRCWECEAEKEIARRDREETIRVAEYKMRRDGFR